MKEMKKNILKYSVAVAAMAITFTACESDIPRGVEYSAYTYASKDEDGGTWKPILLVSGADVIIDAPADVTSSEYLAELAEVKSAAGSLTAEQQEAVDYWGNNTVVRWLEIAEELVAKYNLPPDPGPEGNYPPPTAPSGTTPASPDFPFAHPPFGSRMFAYISAAAYDAAISSWHYKYTYNRPAIFNTDASIAQAYPQNDIPSYPSEDAAIATSMEKILNALFPNDVAFISEKAQECRDSRIWAGLATQSDLNAGDSIGRYVSTIYLNRSKTDNAKYAQTNKAQYDSLVAVADAMWDDWQMWKNIDIPPRPVAVTPKFGNVTPWWIPDVETVRPGPPPAVGSAEYNEAEQELLDIVNNATKEQEEIAFFWNDGPSTNSPPGHWIFKASEKIVDNSLNPLRTARVYAYLNTAMHDAGISCWDTKFYYMYPRPAQANPEIKTLFMTPNFPSYTSGHSTFSGAAAEVLSYFFPSSASEFEQFATDASNSRMYARIHWPFDCTVGVETGHTIGGYSVAAAAADGAD